MTANLVAQLNPRADVEKCAVFTQKKARPAFDQKADGGGSAEEGHGGHAEAEGYGVGAACKGACKGAATPLGLVMAFLALVFVRL